MSLILDEMESDLIIACKCWYGDKGIEKVIGHYCGYNPEDCDLRSKYHFISELLMKLIENKCFTLYCLFDNLSPRNIDGLGGMYESLSTSEKIYNRMVSMICSLQVKDQDKEGNYYTLVELHEPNDKFIEKEEQEVTV